MKITIIAGASPNFMKTAPLIRTIKYTQKYPESGYHYHEYDKPNVNISLNWK